MLLRFLMCLYACCMFALLIFSGCQPFPVVQLDECKMQNTERFVRTFHIKQAANIRYHYKLNRKNSQYIFEGVSHRKGDCVYLAGFSDSGITLFSAKWENGQFTILKNQTKIPTSFLKESILMDWVLPHLRPTKELDCIYLNPAEETMWLLMETDFAGYTGFFVLDHDRKAWCGLNGRRMYYQAEVTKEKGGFPSVIKVTNYQHRYTAEMRLLIDPEADQGDSSILN